MAKQSGSGTETQGRLTPPNRVPQHDVAVDVAPVHASVRSPRGATRLRLIAVAVVLAAGAVVLRSWVGGPGAGFPEAVEGLQVHTVTEVLTLREEGADSGARVAVRGYWSDGSTPHSCVPPTEPPGDLELYCRDGEAGITELNELIFYVHNGRAVVATGPRLTPWIDPGLARAAELATSADQFPRAPIPITVVGHFDDPRAAACRPEARAVCADRLVVDVIAYFAPSAAVELAPLPAATAPPDALFAAAACSENGEFSFVGWTTTKDLQLPFERSGRVFAMVTSSVVLLGGPEWNDDPAGSDHKFRIWGRRICLAQVVEVMEFGFVPDTAYVEWDDGLVTPGVELTRPEGATR